MIVKKIEDEYKIFKFGLNRLIILKEILLHSEQIISDILKILDIKEGTITNEEAFIVEIFKDSFNQERVRNIKTLADVKEFLSNVDFTQQISFLIFSLAGEIGISPNDLFILTPCELEYIYKGYLNRLELSTNCNQIAALRGTNNITEKFSLKSANVNISTKEEREKTFSNLNI